MSSCLATYILAQNIHGLDFISFGRGVLCCVRVDNPRMHNIRGMNIVSIVVSCIWRGGVRVVIVCEVVIGNLNLCVAKVVCHFASVSLVPRVVLPRRRAKKVD